MYFENFLVGNPFKHKMDFLKKQLQLNASEMCLSSQASERLRLEGSQLKASQDKKVCKTPPPGKKSECGGLCLSSQQK
jgi:hypothetical protein